MVINKFKMRSDINSFSLGGMGCSASPIGADLISNLLQNPQLTYGLLISTDNVTQNFY
jgi:3-ketoacyl-CoA synthase